MPRSSPESCSVHLLNAGLTIALAVAVASIAENPFDRRHFDAFLHGRRPGSGLPGLPARRTVGADRPGSPPRPCWQVPARAHSARHGLRGAGFIALGLGVASLWTRLGVPARRRAFESFGLIAAAAALIAACTFVHGSWDVSENRRNSFPRPIKRPWRTFKVRSASKCTWRRRIRAAPISNTGPSRSFAG